MDDAPGAPDLILTSSDSVSFYVHSYILLSFSTDAFGLQWPRPSAVPGEQWPPILWVEESASVLNLLLRVVYSLPCSPHATSAEETSDTLDALWKHGFPVQVLAKPNTALYDLMLNHAAVNPIAMYSAAACYKLDDLAVAISGHLLSFDLSELTNELAERMGAVYLRRLVFLLLGRVEALKRVMTAHPKFHEPFPTCGSTEQRKLTRSWALAKANLSWQFRPGALNHTSKVHVAHRFR